MSDKSRIIKVDYLARVEGEGALYVKIRDGKAIDVQLRIFEAPRLFEGFLRGRSYAEAADITARICGICPVAYQMAAVHAMEDAFGVHVTGPLRDLRRLLYCGEWLESHALHVYMLHAPDFLGYDDGIRMAADHREAVQRGLDLKKAGNALMTALGGRAVHPINVRVGGFFRVPARGDLEAMADSLKRARDQALETVRWVSTFEFPDFEQDYEFVALRHDKEYPLNEGRVVSSAGLDIEVRDYDDFFVEEQVTYTTALHSRIRDRGVYLVGPLARYNLNFDRLSPLAQEASRSSGLAGLCRNPFQSIIVRSIEMVYACDEALRIIASYEPPDNPVIPVQPRSATGYACTEAPRGLLYHRYTVDAAGNIADAKITPPTAQNQKRIESDLYSLVDRYASLSQAALTRECEQAIRNYDPCISCSTHHIQLELDR